VYFWFFFSFVLAYNTIMPFVICTNSSSRLRSRFIIFKPKIILNRIVTLCRVSKMGHCCYIFFPMPLLLYFHVESLFKRKGHYEIRLYKNIQIYL
jgi:hypothetical protein